MLGIDIAPNMIELAKVNNPKAHFEVMDSRQINTLHTHFDAIIGGFCLPYMSTAESNELMANAYQLLNENGFLYLSFVEGDPSTSDFKTGSGGRVYFQYHRLNDLMAQLTQLNFHEIKIFKVQYKTVENEWDTHTILTAKKK